MDDQEISQYIDRIQCVTSNDENAMRELNDYISELIIANPMKLIELSCKTIMSKNEIPITSIQFSFIVLNRVKPYISASWSSFDMEIKDFIKNVLISGILSDDFTIQNFASDVFAFVVRADIYMGILCHILDQISSYVIDSEIPDQNKIGCIFALKEIIQLDILSEKTDYYDHSCDTFCQYLLFILSYPSEFENNFSSIISCYDTIIPFYKKSLNENDYKDHIIPLIQNNLEKESNHDFQNCLYRLLFTVFQTCYENITDNMEQIFQICINSLSSDDEYVIIVPIRFWKEVATFEFQIIKEVERNVQLGKTTDIALHNFTCDVAENLLAPIIEFMFRTARDQPPEVDSGEISLCTEASETILAFGQLSNCVFDFVVNNFEEMSSSSDWQIQYVSLILLSCIIEGPNKHDQIEFFESIFANIISMLNNPSNSIKDAVLWIVGIIFKTYEAIATNNDIFSFLQEIIPLSESEPYIISTRVCDIINIIGRNFEGICNKSSIFQNAFPDLLDAMMKAFDREDAPLTILGVHSTEAIAALITSTPSSHEIIIVNLLKELNNRIIEEFKRPDIVPNEYTQMKIQFYCIIIGAIIKRMGPEINPYSEPIMITLLNLLSKKSAILQLEGLITLSRLIKLTGENVRPYIPQIVQIFITSQESKMSEIVEMSSLLISCLFQTLGGEMTADEDLNKQIIMAFNMNFEDENISLPAKIQILSSMSEMVKILTYLAGTEFTENFVSKLNELQMIFYTSSEQIDNETLCLLTATILDGYASLILSSMESDFIEIVIRNYREVTKIFNKICKLVPYITEKLMVTIINFLKVVLDNIALRVNTQLNKRCVTSVLEFISTIDKKDIAFQASTVLRRIKSC